MIETKEIQNLRKSTLTTSVKNVRYIAAFVLFSVAVTGASGAGLTNGDFEAPAIVGGNGGAVYTVAPGGFGWTIGSGSIDHINSSYWQPSTGAQSIDLNGSDPGTIYQDFTFSSAQAWTISFDLSANPDLFARGDGLGAGVKNVQVDFGTPGQMTTLGVYGVDSGPRTVDSMDWVTITTPQVVVSNSVVYRLQFTSLSGGIVGAALDNIRVQAVPEPTTAALLTVALVGCLLVHLRKVRRSNHLG